MRMSPSDKNNTPLVVPLFVCSVLFLAAQTGFSQQEAPQPPQPTPPFFKIPEKAQVTVLYTSKDAYESALSENKTLTATKRVVKLFGGNEEHSIFYSNGKKTDVYILSGIVFHRDHKTGEVMMDAMPSASFAEGLRRDLNKVALDKFKGVRTVFGKPCFHYQVVEELTPGATTASMLGALPASIRANISKEELALASQPQQPVTTVLDIYISTESGFPVAVLSQNQGQIFEYAPLAGAFDIPEDIRAMFEQNKKYFR